MLDAKQNLILTNVRNPKLLATLPTGFTLTATHQVAARGRGANVWVCPAGSLLFSTVIRHPAHLAASRPIVFLQYLAAIAVVEAIQTYDKGYEDMPIRVKWPNDVCTLNLVFVTHIPSSYTHTREKKKKGKEKKKKKTSYLIRAILRL